MYYQKNQQKKEQIMETPAISMLKKDVEYEQGEITSLEYSRLTLDVPDMNILKWDIKDSTLDDILKNDPSHRKNFLINISIYYNSTNYFHLIYPDHYYNSSKILINHFQAHLSADDISLMLATYNKQMNEYWENSVSLLENLDKIMSKMPNKFKIEPFTFDNPQDEEEINEYKQVFCVENAEILFLNDLKGTKSLTPFLKLIFKIDPFSIESIVASKKAMSCYFEIFLLFYNPFSNKTEPMIEKTPFFIELVKRPEGVYYLNLQLYDQKKIFNQLSNKSPMLNINITEDMLSVFFKVKTSWEEKLWDGQDFENVNKQPINSNDQLAKSPTKKNERLQSHHKKFISSKFANSYTIKNESGYTLRIRKHERNRNFSINKEKIKRNNLDDHKNFLEIKDGESKEYEIEANTNFFEENFCQPVKIYLEFLSYSKTLYYIQDISINRLRMQLKSWNSKKLTKDNLQNKFFMCNVKMKETKSKLNITSPITFFNRTSKSVQITIISEEYAESLIYVIPPLKKKPIPLEYAENQSLFSLKFQLAQEKANFSEKVFTFWSLKTTQGSKGFEGKQGNDFFYLIRGKLITGDKNPRIYKLDIFIESLFSITNSLPLPLEVEFFTKSIKEDNYFPSIKLSCQESYLYELSTINSPVFMHIQLSGLQKSEDIMVFSENMTKKNQKIPLFSELKTDKNEPVNIFMFCQSDGIKVHSIFIYAKGCIINETKEELLFYSVKSLGQQVEFLNKFKLSKNLMPGQTIESSYQILLFDETTEIAIAHKDCPNELSNNISITGSGVVKTAEIKVLNEKEELKKEEKMTELYEFAINISSKCSGTNL